LEFFGSQLTSVVSAVTWTATGGGVRPGQFQDFPISLGQLPESGDLVFTALQTYSSGEKVAWNQVAVDDAAEPEHPAPVLTVTAPGAAPSAVDASDTGDAASTTKASASKVQSEDDSSSALPVGLSVAALLVALGALGLALKRRTV
jgi:hypothetical protein